MSGFVLLDKRQCVVWDASAKQKKKKPCCLLDFFFFKTKKPRLLLEGDIEFVTTLATNLLIYTITTDIAHSEFVRQCGESEFQGR